jgi:hypothetical protein
VLFVDPHGVFELVFGFVGVLASVIGVVLLLGVWHGRRRVGGLVASDHGLDLGACLFGERCGA